MSISQNTKSPKATHFQNEKAASLQEGEVYTLKLGRSCGRPIVQLFFLDQEFKYEFFHPLCDSPGRGLSRDILTFFPERPKAPQQTIQNFHLFP